MKASHIVLLVLGLLTQAFGWSLAPRRWKLPLAVLAGILDAGWCLWYLTDDRSLSVSGFWSLSPVATWLCVLLVLMPIVGVEFLAWILRRWRWWIRGAGLVLVLGGYGWGLSEAYGPPAVTELDLAFPDLPPAFEGYRIVLVSDIHAGMYAGTRTLGRWARDVQALHGDLVVGAGDFIAHLPEEAERTGVAFDAVTPPDGKVGIQGNHDIRHGKPPVEQRLREHGWRMLLDEAWVVERGGQRLVVLGARYPLGDPEKGIPAWGGKPWPEGFRIGICHSPVQWPAMLGEGSRLTLAAHTHGGQVNLSPFYNAAEEVTPYVKGLFTRGRDILYVTRGLGVTGLPLRLRCRPEIVRITLHHSR